MNGWVNSREAGDLRRYRAHYDVIVMNPCEFQSFVVIDKNSILLEINNWVELGWVELIDHKRRAQVLKMRY